MKELKIVKYSVLEMIQGNGEMFVYFIYHIGKTDGECEPVIGFILIKLTIHSLS